MIISLIVARDRKGGIGKNNQLAWHLRSDLQRFKKITMGHHLIMGRKTYQTIGKLLPGRTMIILTRNDQFRADGCVIVNSILEALKWAANNHEQEVFIIGGGSIFNQSIKLAHKIYLTTVDTVVNADVYFPEVDWNEWTEVTSEKFPKSDTDEFAYEYKILERKD